MKKIVGSKCPKNKKYLDKNVYSIDMLRLKVHCPDDDVQAFFSRFNCDSNCEYWESRRLKEYKYNWNFKMNTFDGECSFWVGYYHNSEKSGMKHNLVLEYNPNKVDDKLLWSILKAFYGDFKAVQVVSLDVACDMPVNILDIVHSVNGKRKYRCEKNGGDDITHYYGVRGSDGYTKIYNKARELGLKDIELTRYEVSRRLDIPLEYADNISLDWSCLLEVNVIDSYQYSLELNGTERALLFAVMNGFPIGDLPRKNKEKIKKILSESAGNTLDSTMFGKCINHFFNQLKSNICLM